MNDKPVIKFNFVSKLYHLQFQRTLKEFLPAFLRGKEIMVDGKVIEEEKYPIGLFDTLSLVNLGKSYRVLINDKGRFDVEEIKATEINQKVYKVLGKTSLKNG